MVIGGTGRNFAAGMSGGIAYIYDAEGDFKDKCNQDMVELDGISSEDMKLAGMLLSNHYKYTGSIVAKKILEDFKKEAKKFIKVMPLEYKRILETRKTEEELGLTEVSDG